MIILLREWMGSGVPSGLQNQYEELRASWVSSILTHSRQYGSNSQLSLVVDFFIVSFIFKKI